MRPIPEFRGCNPFFLLKECGELAGILEMQAIGDLGDRQRGASQKLFRTKELLLYLIVGGGDAGVFLKHPAKP